MFFGDGRVFVCNSNCALWKHWRSFCVGIGGGIVFYSSFIPFGQQLLAKNIVDCRMNSSSNGEGDASTKIPSKSSMLSEHRNALHCIGKITPIQRFHSVLLLHWYSHSPLHSPYLFPKPLLPILSFLFDNRSFCLCFCTYLRRKATRCAKRELDLAMENMLLVMILYGVYLIM